MTSVPPDAATDPPSRRRFLEIAGLGAGSAAALAACTSSSGAPAPSNRSDPAASSDPSSAPHPSSAPTGAQAVAASGEHQAGVVTPHPPQHQLHTLVFDLRRSARDTLARLGALVLALTGGRDPHLAGLAPGDLTVTVGAGPRLVSSLGPTLPGADRLPSFPRENLQAPQGDLLVQLCASDPLVLPGCAAAVRAVPGLVELWQQRAFRGSDVTVTPTVSAPRNLLGFVDGIIGPRTPADFAADVWLRGPASVAGGTIAVVRRMQIDLDRFVALGVHRQEQVIGRRRASGVPLSGGTIATDPDLGALTPVGQYVIPADAHLRRANPKSTGVPPMLRRSYSFDDATGAGLLFVSFQNRLATFVSTLNRMSTSDALLEFTTTTHSGTFLVLPGFDEHHSLGSGLFG